MIDLDNGQLPDKADDHTNHSVSIHLAADGADDETSQTRDLALVLKSARPVRWALSSAPVLGGSVLVVSEHPVEAPGLSSRQPVQVRNGHDVPSAFPVLILSVTADLGPPVSYVKAPAGTRRIELVVSKKQAARYASPTSKRRSSFIRRRNSCAASIAHRGRRASTANYKGSGAIAVTTFARVARPR